MNSFNRSALAALTVSFCLSLAACGGGGGAGAQAPSDEQGAAAQPDAPLFLPMTQLAGSPYRQGNADGAGHSARFSTSVGGVTYDPEGNLYVTDGGNNTIRKIAPDGTVSTFAGVAGERGSANGTLAQARFYYPSDIVRDAAGNFYVLDTGTHGIRKIGADGQVTTIAGSSYGQADGTGAAAKFASPEAMAIGPDGNLYVADTSGHTIRKVTPAGVVTTVAGMANTSGNADGVGAAARFNNPAGIAFAQDGSMFVSDRNNHVMRKILADGTVSTVAGQAGDDVNLDGTGAAARFRAPRRIAVMPSGDFIIASGYGRKVRTMNPVTLAVGTLAGSGQQGSEDGPAATAKFSKVGGVALNAAGDLAISDEDGVIRMMAAGSGQVTTFAGAWSAYEYKNDTGTAARFSLPQQSVQDANGIVYQADMNNFSIRKIDANGVVTTLAGRYGYFGSVDGTGEAAQFKNPKGLALGTDGNLYVADVADQTIRKVTPAGVVTTIAGMPGTVGNADGTGNVARFRSPSALAGAPDGNIYVVDTYNHCIRRVTPAGVVTQFAGLCGTEGASTAADNGPLVDARFSYPSGIAIGADGTFYIADAASRIRKISPAGMVSHLAGAQNSAGQADGQGDAALFYNPGQLAVDTAGNVYVADHNNHAVRKITPGGTVTTVVGKLGVSGDTSGQASAATGLIFLPMGVSYGPQGLVIATGHGIVKVSPAP